MARKWLIQLNIPEQLISAAQERGFNFAIQYGTAAIVQSAIGSKGFGSEGVDPCGPAKLLLKGMESLATANTPEEAAQKGTPRYVSRIF